LAMRRAPTTSWSWPLMVDLINGVYGWGWTKEDLDRLNRDVLRAELEFSRRAGITAADYRIAEYMRASSCDGAF
jgi:aldehyde:ferredoxin oxidoreductase